MVLHCIIKIFSGISLKLSFVCKLIIELVENIFMISFFIIIVLECMANKRYKC